LKGRGFRGGSDEKMRRMWFGLEIDVVGLPPQRSIGRDNLNRKMLYWKINWTEKRSIGRDKLNRKMIYWKMNWT